MKARFPTGPKGSTPTGLPPNPPAPSPGTGIRTLGDKQDIIARYKALGQLAKESKMPLTKVRNIIAQRHRSGLTRKTARGGGESIP